MLGFGRTPEAEAGPAGRGRFGVVIGGTPPGPGRGGTAGRQVAGGYRAAGDGRPGTDSRAGTGSQAAIDGRACLDGRAGLDGGLPLGGRRPAGDPLPAGDGLWPGSGLPGGAGRRPDGVRAPWPDLAPTGRSSGRWGRPDPWPVLPDDRPLWSVPDPGGADAEQLRRLDREQAGG
ncbi:hypothetical protein ACQPYA_20990 [Micromonospora sp. CA-263727]|uniref:hypothetical protein n=1 Tax=Micromonospora sp. CA-263727 TaxID=3239967 RepID=UPI003D8DC2C4